MSNTNEGRRATLNRVEVNNPTELPAAWRQQAATLEEFGAAEAAKALGRCAGQLELALSSQGDEPVTLTQAARAKGYTPDHVGRLVRRGKLTNYGRPGAPRVRLSELPCKPSFLPPVTRQRHLVGATRREIARAVASEEVR